MDKILLMYSGGLDSTGALFKLLKEQPLKVAVHHLILDNGEPNLPQAQELAVRQVFRELYKLGLFNYEYTSSSHSFPNGKYAWDSDVAFFMARILINNDPNIKYLALGVNKEDRVSGSNNPDVWTSVKEFDILTEKKIQRIYPVETFTKKEIIEFLPYELIKASWSCRSPKMLNGAYIPCERCKSCAAMRMAQR